MKSLSQEKRKQAEHLIEIINKAFQCNIKEKCRQTKYVNARALAYVLLRKFAHLSYEQIGFVFNRDHATIIHGVKEWPYMVKFNKDLAIIHDEVVASWTQSSDSEPYMSCEEQVIFLRKQINSLTLQLVQAHEALESEKQLTKSAWSK